MKTAVIISIDGGKSTTVYAKDTAETKEIIDDVREKGISFSDKDFTYFYFPHRVKEIRVSRGEE